MLVVVVELLVKVKIINKYLGLDYIVFVLFGYVCDLFLKNGLVDFENDFEMLWEVLNDSCVYVKVIVDVFKIDDELIFVIDFDCEGEVISWYLQEMLIKCCVIKKSMYVFCVIFNVIIKVVIIEVMQQLCEIDVLLVEVYFVCCVLDYFVGFNLLLVLWCKLFGVKFVGWVQFVCLCLIVECEMEIEVFCLQEYWIIKVFLINVCG